MRRLGALLMARLFTAMLSAIEESAALVGAFEESRPMLDCYRAVRCDVRLTALKLVATVAAENILLHLSTIAASGHADLTGTA